MNIHIILRSAYFSVWEDFYESSEIKSKTDISELKQWIINNNLSQLPYNEMFDRTDDPLDMEYILTEKESALFLLRFA